MGLEWFTGRCLHAEKLSIAWVIGVGLWLTPITPVVFAMTGLEVVVVREKRQTLDGGMPESPYEIIVDS